MTLEGLIIQKVDSYNIYIYIYIYIYNIVCMHAISYSPAHSSYNDAYDDSWQKNLALSHNKYVQIE